MYRARFKGTEYQIHSLKSGGWKIESEIGDFYAFSIESVVLKFRSAVKEGPQ